MDDSLELPLSPRRLSATVQGALQAAAFLSAGLVIYQSSAPFALPFLVAALLSLAAGIYVDRVRTKAADLLPQRATLRWRAFVAVWALALTVVVFSGLWLAWLFGICLALTADRVLVPARDFIKLRIKSYTRRNWVRLTIQAKDEGLAEALRDDDGTVLSVIAPRDLPLGPVYAPLEDTFAPTYRSTAAPSIVEFETPDERQRRTKLQNASLLAAVVGVGWLPASAMTLGLCLLVYFRAYG